MPQSSVRLTIMFLSLGIAWQAVFAQATNAPKLFAPGVISGPADDLSPAFSPDGNSLFFTRSNSAGLQRSNKLFRRPLRDFFDLFRFHFRSPVRGFGSLT